MIVKMLLCAVFLIAINITDFKGYKIKNNTVLPMLIAGLICGIVTKNFTDSLWGMLLPLILFPLYALRMLGAGDVKALCAIGAVVGLKCSALTMAFTFVAGGIIALVFIIFHKNFLERIKYLWGYLKLCFATFSFQKYDFGGNTKSYFRFAYAITAGTVIMFINEYLQFVSF